MKYCHPKDLFNMMRHGRKKHREWLRRKIAWAFDIPEEIYKTWNLWR